MCGSVGISKRHNRWGCLKPKQYEAYNKCIWNGVHGWMGVFRARSLVQRRTSRVGGPRRFSVSPGGRTFTSEIVHGVCFCGVRGDSGVATADSLLAYRYDVLTTRTRVVTHIPMCWCTCVLWCWCINMYQALHDRSTAEWRYKLRSTWSYECLL